MMNKQVLNVAESARTTVTRNSGICILWCPSCIQIAGVSGEVQLCTQIPVIYQLLESRNYSTNTKKEYNFNIAKQI